MKKLITCIITLVAIDSVSFAQKNARTLLVDVAPSSIEAGEILKAEIAFIKLESEFSKVSIELSPLVIKKNDKCAYLVARVLVSGPRPAGYPNDPFFSKEPFLQAILHRENGHWISDGYMGGKPKHGGSIIDMCGYGEGVGADAFRECGAKHGK